MDHDQYERDTAEANAPRMAHMSGRDIRDHIASIKDYLASFDHSAGSPAVVETERRDELRICRVELLRRSCASFSLPMLTTLQKRALDEASKGKLISETSSIIILCLDLCDMGLLTERTKDKRGRREFRLTPMGQSIIDESSDDAINLYAAIQIKAVTDAVSASIMASYAESVRGSAADAPALEAAE